MTSETLRYPRLLAALKEAIEAKCKTILGSVPEDVVSALVPVLVKDHIYSVETAQAVFKGGFSLTPGAAVFLAKELGCDARKLLDAQTDDQLAEVGEDTARVTPALEKKAAKVKKEKKPKAAVSHSPLFASKPATSVAVVTPRAGRRPFDF